MTADFTTGARPVKAARGTELTAKSWQTEAPLRMLMNNLDPEVAERPDDLVVYGGTGRAVRSWAAFDAITRTLESMEKDETLGPISSYSARFAKEVGRSVHQVLGLEPERE